MPTRSTRVRIRPMSTGAQVKELLTRVRQTIDHSRLIQARSRFILEEITTLRIVDGSEQGAFSRSGRQSSAGED